VRLRKSLTLRGAGALVNRVPSARTCADFPNILEAMGASLTHGPARTLSMTPRCVIGVAAWLVFMACWSPKGFAIDYSRQSASSPSPRLVRSATQPTALSEVVYQNTRGNSEGVSRGAFLGQGLLRYKYAKASALGILGCHRMGRCLSPGRSTGQPECCKRHCKNTGRSLQNVRSPYNWRMDQGTRPGASRH
jgi:hypothetical protein